MAISEIRGDLFEMLRECRSENVAVSLMHCVSRDLKMGKGIAVLFKKKFGRVDQLIDQNKDVGQVAILDMFEDDKEQDSFVYYLVTKPSYWDKPTYKTLRDSLEEAKKHAVANKVRAILMPKIGCGLDRLEWPKVKQILREVFDETSIIINVFYL